MKKQKSNPKQVKAIRFYSADWKVIVKTARAQGKTTSEYIRQVVMAALVDLTKGE